jgi:alkanesulfonate monooxygenase SsuD/methylene tetrahydromethanopterin reductase-like flavin-dependent oxidoreductase (luciferase family)
MQTYEGKPDAAFRGGTIVVYLDPVVLISAMAAVSRSMAFGITSSTSYVCEFRQDQFIWVTSRPLIAPFILARTLSTLDHVARERIAWNVVMSYSNSAAQAMGHDKVQPSEAR